jgi:hypothetical protein
MLFEFLLKTVGPRPHRGLTFRDGRWSRHKAIPTWSVVCIRRIKIVQVGFDVDYNHNKSRLDSKMSENRVKEKREIKK